MKKILMVFATGGLICTGIATTAIADSHEGDGMSPATPVELFTCNYNEGKGPADLDKATNAWNAWADSHNISDYSAWTLVPYYSGPEQEFDFIWLGGSPKAASLGRTQDLWLATGSKEIAGFNDAISCDTHANFATLRIKKPPKRENPNNIVISFTDCNMAEGVTFEDLVPSLTQWAEYRESHGSTSGMWVLFPAYGGGGEGFDFKFVAAWQNLEDQGKDYDQYNEAGWEKGNELFSGKVNCDSSRVYLGSNVRMGDSGED